MRGACAYYYPDDKVRTRLVACWTRAPADPPHIHIEDTQRERVRVRVHARARACAYARASVHACVRACVRACVYVSACMQAYASAHEILPMRGSRISYLYLTYRLCM